MMKICIISHGFPYPGLPFFTFVGELCKALSEQGEDITVIASQSVFKPLLRHEPRIPFKYVLKVKGGNDIIVYTPKVISVSTLPIVGKLINGYFAQRAVTKTIRRHVGDVDVFYGHFFVEGFYALPEVKRRNKPLIIASGETNVTFRSSYKPKIKDFLQQLKGVICVSTKNKDEAVAAGLTYEDKCIVLPNSVDNSLFHKMDRKECRLKLGFDENVFIVAFTGYFTYRKGSRRVSDAITMLNDSQIKSIFIGRNNDGEEAEPNCKGILFKGFMDHNVIPTYLGAADVFVLPTRAEGCCNAVVEALACGLPVISSNRKFNYDVLNETNSILVEPDDVEAISKAIKTLKDDPELRKKLSQGALAMAASLTIQERAKKIIQFIQQSIIS